MIKGTKEAVARMLMQDGQDLRFREIVRTRVFDVLRDASPTTFEHILKKSLNCDPALVLELLHELQDADFVCSTKGHATRVRYWLKARYNSASKKHTPLTRPATTAPPSSPLNSRQPKYLSEILQEMLDALPEPAPVHSQWWFSKSVYRCLIDFILDVSKGQTTTAFLGAPTLGALFSQCSCNPVYIFDVDEVILKRIGPYCSKSTRIMSYNVSHNLDSSIKGMFPVVFADPPWSSSLLQTFLIRSSALVSGGGILAISFPQPLTRPTIPSEGKKLKKLASRLGLSLKFNYPNFTEYAVPLFEHEAYKRSGIRLKKPWRKGDLFIFVKTHNCSIDPAPFIAKTPQWNQYHHGKTRMFLKRDGLFEDGAPSVEAIPGLEDLVHRSTSSRMPSWNSASLVSSRNRIAHAFGRKELSTFLDRCFKKTHREHEDEEHSSLTMPLEMRKLISHMLGGGLKH